VAHDVNANLVFTCLHDLRFADSGGEVAPFLPVEIVNEPELRPASSSGAGRIEIELAESTGCGSSAATGPEALARLLRGMSS
jgi:hypothetical protein